MLNCILNDTPLSLYEAVKSFNVYNKTLNTQFLFSVRDSIYTDLDKNKYALFLDLKNSVPLVKKYMKLLDRNLFPYWSYIGDNIYKTDKDPNGPYKEIKLEVLKIILKEIFNIQDTSILDSIVMLMDSNISKVDINYKIIDLVSSSEALNTDVKNRFISYLYFLINKNIYMYDVIDELINIIVTQADAYVFARFRASVIKHHLEDMLGFVNYFNFDDRFKTVNDTFTIDDVNDTNIPFYSKFEDTVKSKILTGKVNEWYIVLEYVKTVIEKQIIVNLNTIKQSLIAALKNMLLEKYKTIILDNTILSEDDFEKEIYESPKTAAFISIITIFVNIFVSRILLFAYIELSSENAINDLISSVNDYLLNNQEATLTDLSNYVKNLVVSKFQQILYSILIQNVIIKDNFKLIISSIIDMFLCNSYPFKRTYITLYNHLIYEYLSDNYETLNSSIFKTYIFNLDFIDKYYSETIDSLSSKNYIISNCAAYFFNLKHQYSNTKTIFPVDILNLPDDSDAFNEFISANTSNTIIFDTDVELSSKTNTIIDKIEIKNESINIDDYELLLSSTRDFYKALITLKSLIFAYNNGEIFDFIVNSLIQLSVSDLNATINNSEQQVLNDFKNIQTSTILETTIEFLLRRIEKDIIFSIFINWLYETLAYQIQSIINRDLTDNEKAILNNIILNVTSNNWKLSKTSYMLELIDKEFKMIDNFIDENILIEKLKGLVIGDARDFYLYLDSNLLQNFLYNSGIISNSNTLNEFLLSTIEDIKLTLIKTPDLNRDIISAVISNTIPVIEQFENVYLDALIKLLSGKLNQILGSNRAMLKSYFYLSIEKLMYRTETFIRTHYNVKITRFFEQSKFMFLILTNSLLFNFARILSISKSVFENLFPNLNDINLETSCVAMSKILFLFNQHFIGISKLITYVS